MNNAITDKGLGFVDDFSDEYHHLFFGIHLENKHTGEIVNVSAHECVNIKALVVKRGRDLYVLMKTGELECFNDINLYERWDSIVVRQMYGDGHAVRRAKQYMSSHGYVEFQWLTMPALYFQLRAVCWNVGAVVQYES